MAISQGSQGRLIPAIQTVITLHGHCPSKKNLWQRGKSGKMFLDAAVKREIDMLTLQARAQWPDNPAKHPDIRIQFYVRDQRADRDNKLTTVLDCLRAAGVILNDNIAQFNGMLTVLPAIVEENEKTVVEILA